MASRNSQFYVDTPVSRDVSSQRHSMFVTHSDLDKSPKQDLSSASSSATLPSAAGSVDRLTGLGEKKTPRFFTLKPKTSFSLRPFFSSSSIASLSPSKKRRNKSIESTTPRRDSYVQTDGNERAFYEVGVQTLNASTVDVPVQTCFREWDENDIYSYRRPLSAGVYRPIFQRWPSAGYSSLLPSSVDSNSNITATEAPTATKNSYVTPLASSKLLKYAVLDDAPISSEKAVSPLKDVNTGEAALSQAISTSEAVPISTNVPVKYFSAKELISYPQEVPKPLTAVLSSNLSENNQPVSESEVSSNGIENLNHSIPAENAKNFDVSLSHSSKPADTTKKSDDSLEVSDESNAFLPTTDRPHSALKIDRNDSPVKHSFKVKTVHFALSDPSDSTPKKESECLKPRNLDNDFEALLRDLDILTDDPKDLSENIIGTPLKFSSSPILECPPKQTIFSTNLKSAFESLNHEILPSISENADEGSEIDSQSSSNVIELKSDKEKTNDECDLKINLINSISCPVKELEAIKDSAPTPKLDEAENKLANAKNDSLKFTSSTVFTTAKLDLDPKSGRKRENVYDSGIEENALKTAPLPTLPSFFDTLSKCKEHPVDTAVPNETCSSTASIEFPILIESDKDKMLSRSSSRCSMRSNSESDFLDTAQKFDSCENLDQLEEEIIRSLCTPNEDNFTHNENNCQLASENSELLDDRSACEIRRAILDRSISGGIQDGIPPFNASNFNSSVGVTLIPENKINPRQSIKYTATLTKFEAPKSPSELSFISKHNQCVLPFDASTTLNNTPEFPTKAKGGKSANILKPTQGETSVLFYPVQNGNDFAKTSSLVLSPENNPRNTASGESLTLDKRIESLHDGTISSQLEIAPVSMNNPPSQTTAIAMAENNTTPKGSSSGTCDFTNCLRPSKLQNNTFLEKINARSIPYGSSPDASHSADPAHNSVPSDSGNGATQVQNLNTQCDYASCLKPSQVQNSIFSAELSEITANKSSSYDSDLVCNNSPLTTRTNSPQWTNIYSSGVPTKKGVEKNVLDDQPENEIQHKSEITITLQRPMGKQAEMSQEEKDKTKTSEHFSQGNAVINDSSSTELCFVQEAPLKNLCVPSPTLLMSSEITNPSNERSIPQAGSILPPPPPPPLPSKTSVSFSKNMNTNQIPMESMIRNQHSNLINVPESYGTRSTSKSPVMLELEKRFETPKKNLSEGVHRESNRGNNLSSESLDIEVDGNSVKGSENSPDSSFVSQPPINAVPYKCNGFSSNQKELNSSSPYDRKANGIIEKEPSFSTKPVTSDAPPPPGAILLDKKVTVEGDQIHTDKYYAIPVKEVLKETTTTTKFIPAPPKYEGIGPTEDGVPIGLRNSVKKENMHNWYKTMFKSLNKADSSNDNQEYIIGYSSEPETSKREKAFKKKSATLDNRSGHNTPKHGNLQGYPPSAKSSIEIYNVHPRLIEDYEPGHCSVTDDEVSYCTKRHLPPLNPPKPAYEFKNGYEPDNNFIRNLDQPPALSPNELKIHYKEIQRGGDVPQYGLSKPAPEKPKDPVIGPLPPPPLNYHGPVSPQATRPLELPANYYNYTDNGLCQQSNGLYEMQMRQAIHTELQHRISPTSSLMSSPSRSILKSPSRSPDLKIPARALFDFKPESSKEIPLTKGDFVLILRQLDKNWYEGERQGTIGIFPISYVEIVPPEHASTPTKSLTEGYGKVMFDFTAQTTIELSVRKGDTVNLLRKVDSNWYEAFNHNKKGIIPASYLQVLQEPAERNTFSPKPCLKSPRGSSGSRESLHKTNSNPSSPYSSSVTTSSSLDNTRNKLQTRGKKGSSLIEPVMYKAMYSYSPQNTDELELLEGDIVCVVEMCDDGWYVGTSVRTGVFGIFPGNYVEKV